MNIIHPFRESGSDSDIVVGAVTPPNDRVGVQQLRRQFPHLQHVEEHQTAIVERTQQQPEGEEPSFHMTDMRDTATTLSERPIGTRMFVQEANHELGEIVPLRTPPPGPIPLEVPSSGRKGPDALHEFREPTPIRPLAPISPFRQRS